MESIFSPNAPKPAGHYSQAIVHQGLVFVAGQLPIDPEAPDRPAGPIAEQTEQVMRNVAAILDAAGSGLGRVLQVTIYISDISQWGDVNAIYSRMMGEHRPARAIVPTRDLHHGYQVEIQVVAAVEV